MTRPPLTTAEYWQWRYTSFRGSGAGNYGLEGKYKTRIVNEALREHGVTSVLDVGCGDGTAAARLDVQGYVGYDPSPAAVERCRILLPDRQLTTTVPSETFDATLSLDVIYHLVDDAGYAAYLDILFGRARRVVIVYGTHQVGVGPAHVRHRLWLADVPPEWHVVQVVQGPFKCLWVFRSLTHGE
jgi:SAM-dependent methyltransferase